MLLVTAIAAALPFLWVISLSLQDAQAVFRVPPELIPRQFLWSTYILAWVSQSFGRMYWNSILSSTLIIVAQILTCSLAAYALTQLRFRGKQGVFLLLISTMMVPVQVTFIPAYIVLSKLNWVNTYYALIIPFAASGFAIFLMRQTFLTIPQSLIDAAKIEGAGHWVMLSRILLPLAKPTVITLTALNFVWHYNDFFWPLIVTNSSDMRTLPVGLAQMIVNEGGQGTQWNQVMAADVITVAPVLVAFFFLQRHLTSTVLTAGLK
jgi:ABC-type glycerol-3-phosphate transport system permease component